jgi:hypothetical protein
MTCRGTNRYRTFVENAQTSLSAGGGQGPDRDNLPTGGARRAGWEVVPTGRLLLKSLVVV